MAETVAKHGKGPYEHPTFGMQLGGSDIHFIQVRSKGVKGSRSPSLRKVVE